MSWGIDNEKKAVRRYQEWKSASLRRAVSVLECGLFIDTQRHWLAASPDGIVTDDKTGKRLFCLEVKCPYKHRDRRVEDACREDRNFCLEILDQDGETSQQVKKKKKKKLFQGAGTGPVPEGTSPQPSALSLKVLAAMILPHRPLFPHVSRHRPTD